MRRLVILLLLSLTICFSSFAQTVRVGILNGPSCVPLAQMMNKKSNYSFSQYADPQALLPKLLKKEVDCGFLPVNVAAKVYNSSSKALVLLAVSGNGNIKLITSDASVKQFSDLIGKTLYVAGQGATPDYITRYLLAQNDIKTEGKDGIELSFSVPTPQLAAQLISGKIAYVVVPEPFSTVALSKSDKVIAAIDYQEEYRLYKGANADFPLTVLVATREFAENAGDSLDKFLKDYEKSYKWTLKHAVQAGNICEENNLGLAADIVTKAIPVSNYVYIPAQEARANIEDFLKILLDFSPESVGGKLPEADFYYAKTNP
ncbi:MAG: ABC transporter substrate-binding protein [Treponema sp.]|nr:ABC transporter substrate-binding protein [Treponema sp.]